MKHFGAKLCALTVLSGLCLVACEQYAMGEAVGDDGAVAEGQNGGSGGAAVRPVAAKAGGSQDAGPSAFGPPSFLDANGFSPVATPGSQVIGGSDATLGQFPWQVSIGQLGDATQLFNDRVFPHFCGGSLVGDRWVVTAGHCVFGEDAAQIYVRLGDIRRSDLPDSNVHLRAVSKITLNPGYTNASSWQDGNDIAILELSEPVKYTRAVRPIALAKADPVVGGSGTVSGWGRTDGWVAAGSDVLQFAALPIHSSADCNRAFTWETNPVNDKMLCVGHEDATTASCNGDSGGPLAYRSSASKPYELAGVVSWGETGCGSYSVFTRVTQYTSWVQGVVPKTYKNGDVNVDGCVDATDRTLVLGVMNQAVNDSTVMYDTNLNGVIDTGDYYAVVSNLGAGC